MSGKTLTIGIVIIMLAGLAYYYGTGRDAAQSNTNATTTAQQSGAAGSELTQQPDLPGTWRSTEDGKFTREFQTDGTVTDRYEGDAAATETTTWQAVDVATETGLPVPAANLSGVTVIKINFEDGPMYFSINTLTATELQMTNLSGRGNILTFARVQ